MSAGSPLSRRFSAGDRVVAYGKYPGVVVDALAYSAYAVTSDLVAVPGKKRRVRHQMVVAESNLEPEETNDG